MEQKCDDRESRLAVLDLRVGAIIDGIDNKFVSASTLPGFLDDHLFGKHAEVMDSEHYLNGLVTSNQNALDARCVVLDGQNDTLESSRSFSFFGWRSK